MKINNRGWGLGVMIGFIVVFTIFIIVIAILAYHLGVGGKDVPVPIKDDSLIGYFSHL